MDIIEISYKKFDQIINNGFDECPCARSLN